MTANPYTLDYVDGGLVIRWRGERIGYLEYRGDGCVSGTAIFGREVWDSDDWRERGVPLHWVEPAVTKMCAEVEAREARAVA